ncbi:MAG: mechanosensitive ion channel family protein [Solirubrobacteraceae bacterium]
MSSPTPTVLATSVLGRAGDTVGQYLPRIGAALILLIVGLLLVRLLGRLLARLLLRAGIDGLADRLGVHDVLVRAGLERSLSRLVAAAVRIALAIVVIFAALSLTGLQFLQGALNQGVLFLPRLLAALALVLIGLVLAGTVRQRIERIAYQMDLGGPLGTLSQSIVLGVFAILALGELGIPTSILTVLGAITASGAALTLALAFGLGGRDLARELSAGRYVTGVFKLGQTITLAGQHGQIVAFDAASTVLETADGSRLRIPNHLFLETVITEHATPNSGDAL